MDQRKMIDNRSDVGKNGINYRRKRVFFMIASNSVQNTEVTGMTN